MSLYTALTQCIAVLVKQRHEVSDAEGAAEIDRALIDARAALADEMSDFYCRR